MANLFESHFIFYKDYFPLKMLVLLSGIVGDRSRSTTEIYKSTSFSILNKVIVVYLFKSSSLFLNITVRI